VTFDPSAGVSINPCDIPADQTEPDKNKLSFLTTLISRMASDKGEALGLQERNVVQAAIRQAYLRNLRTAPDGTALLEPLFLHDIVGTLRNLGAVAGTHDLSDEDRAIARRIATRLYQWVDRGRYAELVDRPTTVNLTENWILFDTAPLAQEPELLPVAILIITDLVWRHVSSSAGRPTLLVLDEVWALLADRIAGDFIQDLYRRLRTTGSGVLSISQDMADFRDSEHAVAILSNAQTYYLTRSADPEFTASLLRLNARQARQLGSMSMAKGVFGELMIVRRLGDRQEAAICAYVPTPQDRWISESDASTRLLRDRYVREYADVMSAIEALARDAPRGMPSRPAASRPEPATQRRG
jgi:type IV secretory pathway VirB4 component